jgi:uncharacterized membrane protein
MRKVALVFATLFLLGTSALGFLGANRGLKDAKSIDEIYGSSKDEIAAVAAIDKDAGELQRLGQSTGKLKAGAVVFGLAGLMALALLVMSYAGKSSVPLIAAAVVGAALVGTFVSPQYDLGPMAPASARSLGYVLTVLAVVGAAAAYGAAAIRRRRVGATA